MGGLGGVSTMTVFLIGLIVVDLGVVILTFKLLFWEV